MESRFNDDEDDDDLVPAFKIYLNVSCDIKSVWYFELSLWKEMLFFLLFK